MRKRIWKLGAVFLIFLLSVEPSAASSCTDYSNPPSYVYGRDGEPLKIPAAYEYKRAVDLKGMGELEISSFSDMFVGNDGMVYLLETELGAIVCLDNSLKLNKIMTEFELPEGGSTTLKKPEGIFVTADQEYYIADTGNNRILVSDSHGRVSRIIEKPEAMLGTDLSSFLPSKVVVDSAGRISVAARNINSGLMQFSREGQFTGYAGAPAVSMDAFTRLLRKFSTEAQRAQMQQFVPTEYSNIKIDSKNFIWGTISSISINSMNRVIGGRDLSGKVTPIKKLNTMGTDVLRRKGSFAPLGDLVFVDSPSKIIDVGLGPNGIYSLLDSTRGRIFTYNNDGIMLYAFGQKGTRKGDLQLPTAIDYTGDSILVLDSGLCQIVVYGPTAYGSLLIEAEGCYERGAYEEANQLWAQVAELNSNFDYAYVGLGNAKYSVKEYEEAMEYYEYADDRENYSKAMEKLRKNAFEQVFPLVFGAALAIFIGSIAVYILKKIRRYARGE